MKDAYARVLVAMVGAVVAESESAAVIIAVIAVSELIVAVMGAVIAVMGVMLGRWMR